MRARTRRGFVGSALAGLASAVVTAALAAGIAAAAAEAVPYVLIVGPTDNYAALIAGIAEGLQAGGFPDASKVRIDVQNVRSFAQAKGAIRAALDGGAGAIVTVFGQSTRAARESTTAVPVVFCPVADPVAARYVESPDAPGGNLTGVASADAEAVGQRLDAFAQVLPGLKRLGVFYDSTSPLDRAVLANLERAAPGRGLTLVPREIADADQAMTVLRELDRSQVDAVFFLGDALLRRSGEEIGRVAVERKLPVLVGDPDIDTAGVVAAIGPNQERMGRLCGETVAKLLKGAKPQGLRVAHPPFDLVVSLKAAREVGIAVPEAALAKAARVLR